MLTPVPPSALLWPQGDWELGGLFWAICYGGGSTRPYIPVRLVGGDSASDTGIRISPWAAGARRETGPDWLAEGVMVRYIGV